MAQIGAQRHGARVDHGFAAAHDQAADGELEGAGAGAAGSGRMGQVSASAGGENKVHDRAVELDEAQPPAQGKERGDAQPDAGAGELQQRRGGEGRSAGDGDRIQLERGREAVQAQMEVAERDRGADGGGGTPARAAQQVIVDRAAAQRQPKAEGEDHRHRGDGHAHPEQHAAPGNPVQNACPKVMKSWVDEIPGNAFRLWPRSMRMGPTAV